MDEIDNKDLLKIKELLARTGEFIAYFELVENKMAEWRVELEEKATEQDTLFKKQIQAIQLELGSIQETLTMAGLAKFRLQAEESLKQGQAHLKALDKFKNEFIENMIAEKDELKAMTQTGLLHIENHTKQSIHAIDSKLGAYDVEHFSKTANESCTEIEKTANNAISTSTKLLKHFHWRTAGLSMVITLLTALTVGLYMNDELPWEIHKHAMNERQAGQLLMNAWSKLSQKERLKILGEQATPNINRA